MAFDKKHFAPAGNQSARGLAPQMFTYRTADAPATLDTAGYFNDVRGLLELGDTILRVSVDNADTPTSVTTAGFHVVVNKSATAVDVSDTLALTMTDTD